MTTIRLSAVLLFSVLLLASCAREEQQPTGDVAQPNVSTEQMKLAGVKLGQLEYRLVSGVISCTGEIELPPQNMASVTAPLGGYIVDTEILPGAVVKKGALLARLRNPEYITLQQSYLETMGQLKFAAQEYDRQKQLQEQNATAGKRLQESESTFNVLKARVAGLKEQLRLIGIDFKSLEQGDIQSVVALRSPIAGYVTTVNHHPGQFVEPREVIFEVVNMDELHLHLNVFERDITRVGKDQVVRFRPAGGRSDSFTGRVSLVSPKKNEEARTFDVHGHIETGEDKLKPGMYVDAEILVSDDSVYALPQRALIRNNNESFVVTEANGNYTIEPIKTGLTMDGWVEIVDPESFRGRNIVTEGASRVYAALR
jgi:cobalt-zinc-cadmium efflux system membrane fusion protein